MIHQTPHAKAQVRALFTFYLKKERYEAHVNLAKAVRSAAGQIEAHPNDGAPYPMPYPMLARWGYLWLKEGRYWFGWSMARGYPVVTNVFFETSAMWRRVKPDEGDLAQF